MRGVIVAAFLSLLAAVPAAAQPVAPVQGPTEALAQDAGEYARQYGVPLEEATRRLRAQEESVAATDRIQDQYRDRLAGISIEHRPDYRIVAYLTGTRPVPEQRIVVGGMTVPIVFRTGARATREQVVWAITWHQAEIRAVLSNPPAMGLDPRTGELVVTVGQATATRIGEAALRQKFEAIAHVPVQIRVLDRTDRNLDVEGGSRLEGVSPENGKRYYCTTGFAVTDGRRDGVITAAHCLDSLDYLDPQHRTTPLEFVGQWGWGYHDVQIHVSGVPLRPIFFADSGKTQARAVEGWRGRSSMRAGDFVCHRGETTGYSCAEVMLVDFAPAGDLCGGACLPTWVAVAGPGCKGGDSGGPVFVGTTALGILKGASYRPDGSCALWFYMSVDYLPHGWALMSEAPQGQPAPPPSAAVQPAGGGLIAARRR